MVGPGCSHAAATGLRKGDEVNEVVSLLTTPPRTPLPGEVVLFSADVFVVLLSHSHQGNWTLRWDSRVQAVASKV